MLFIGNRQFVVIIKRFLCFSLLGFFFVFNVNAYPIFARQYFSSPREVSGRIACSYCHLAQKAINLSMPHSVFPNTVFEAVIKIPYEKNLKQISGQGNKTGLNIGAILILPDGYSLAPIDRIPSSLKEKINNLAFLPYNNANKSTFMVGPVNGEKYNRELIFPVLAPDYGDSNANFIKSSIYVGGNRGRGQLYPNGEKSNNNIYTSSVNGKIREIKPGSKNDFNILIETKDKTSVIETVGPGANLIVKEGQEISIDQSLTTDPNVGGFGQFETEILLQNPVRLQNLLLFSFFIFLSQIFLVLKKKQFEKVQLFDMNF
uniref:Apocytochrome F n=1 Tax=Lotharella vacuolata TaxID=74820 RepID=A0A140JZS3_9EUKA|nr:apocytochrome F [Lotharella vacuolata]BAU62600.1 apocytochrome F [Lotharella vacuolata]